MRFLQRSDQFHARIDPFPTRNYLFPARKDLILADLTSEAIMLADSAGHTLFLPSRSSSTHDHQTARTPNKTVIRLSTEQTLGYLHRKLLSTHPDMGLLPIFLTPQSCVIQAHITTVQSLNQSAISPRSERLKEHI